MSTPLSVLLIQQQEQDVSLRDRQLVFVLPPQQPSFFNSSVLRVTCLVQQLVFAFFRRNTWRDLFFQFQQQDAAATSSSATRFRSSAS
jgi:hypothetical protein